mmetsp:Transcript_6956/g.12521  ORF Transcript_6956/g.12521 Transcript_6956/m.12521 type:complete len:266 (-) Transcript_6956:650-1447(-)
MPRSRIALRILCHVLQKFRLLPLQFWGLLLVNVVEHCGQRRRSLLLRRLQGLEDVNFLLVADRLHPLLVEPPLGLAKPPKPIDRVVLVVPFLDLLRRPVPGRVVARGVVAHPVAHSLDKHGPVLAQGELLRPGRRGVDCEEVVAVHSDARHAVPLGPRRDPVSPVLVGDGRGDGEAVVPAEEDDRSVHGRGDVHGGVEVTFARSTISKVAHRDACCAVGSVSYSLHLHGVRRPGRLRQLRRQRTADGVKVERPAPVVNRHLPPLP